MKMIVRSCNDTDQIRFWFLDTCEGFNSRLGLEGEMNPDFRAAFAVVCAIHHAQQKYPTVHRLVIFNDNPTAVEMLKSFKPGDGENYNQLLICAADILLKCKILLEVHSLPQFESVDADTPGGGKFVGVKLPGFRRFKKQQYSVPQHLREIAKLVCDASRSTPDNEGQ